jgi:hypothetical protein
MVSPLSFEPDHDVSDNPGFLELLAYWNEKRGSRTLPLRKEVDPVELQKHLGSLNLIECLPGLTDFRYRLIGTSVVQAYGRDSSGRTVLELYAAATRSTAIFSCAPTTPSRPARSSAVSEEPCAQ